MLGRYRRPRSKERFFLFVDIVGSTPVAERLGAHSVHRHLDRISQLASDPIDDHDGEVYQYVGDAIVITWTLAEGRAEARPLACFFAIEAAMAGKRIDALTVVDDGLLNIHVKRIADLAAKSRLPSIGITEIAAAGGLMSYGVNLGDLYRRSASVVGKILRGAKPADIPVERPTLFEMVVNLKTAKALGIRFPAAIQARVTRMIE